MAAMDRLPKWARDALNESRFKIRASDIEPLVRSGQMHQGNIRELLRQNAEVLSRKLDEEQSRRWAEMRAAREQSRRASEGE